MGIQEGKGQVLNVRMQKLGWNDISPSLGIKCQILSKSICLAGKVGGIYIVDIKRI